MSSQLFFENKKQFLVLLVFLVFAVPANLAFLDPLFGIQRDVFVPYLTVSSKLGEVHDFFAIFALMISFVLASSSAIYLLTKGTLFLRALVLISIVPVLFSFLSFIVLFLGVLIQIFV